MTHVSAITRSVNTSPNALCADSKSPYGSRPKRSVWTGRGQRGPGGSSGGAVILCGLVPCSSSEAIWAALGASRAAESCEQLAAAADARLLEYGFEVVLDRVAGDEESLRNCAGVKPRDERSDDLALALGQRVGAAEQVERLGRCRCAEG